MASKGQGVRGVGVVPEPKYISAEALGRILDDAERCLASDQRAWWAAHRVEPVVALRDNQAHYVVAVFGTEAVVFFDDEDEFGRADFTTSSHRLQNCGLVGDLADVIATILSREEK